MANRYFVVQPNGSEKGPIDIIALVHLARIGELHAQTYLRLDGQTQYLQAVDLTEFLRGRPVPMVPFEVSASKEPPPETKALVPLDTRQRTLEINLAYTCAAIGMLTCCLPFSVFSLYFAGFAIDKKQVYGFVVYEACKKLLIFQIVVWVIYAVLAYIFRVELLYIFYKFME